MPNGEQERWGGWFYPWWKAWQEDIRAKGVLPSLWGAQREIFGYPVEEPFAPQRPVPSAERAWRAREPRAGEPAPTGMPEYPWRGQEEEAAWGAGGVGGEEYVAWEIEKRMEPQRGALIKQLEQYAEGLGELLTEVRPQWEQMSIAELQETVELYRQDWEQRVLRPRERRGEPGRGAFGRDLMETMQRAEEWGVDTSWIESVLNQSAINRPSDERIAAILSQRMSMAALEETRRQSLVWMQEQQGVATSFPEEWAALMAKQPTPAWPGPDYKLTTEVPWIQKQPEYQALRRRLYPYGEGPEGLQRAREAEETRQRMEEEAELEWERMRRGEMAGGRGRWGIPRQW